MHPWLRRTLWTALIIGNGFILFDAWRVTPQGQATLARWGEKAERIKNCEGCAKRRQSLKAMVNRVHWDAEQIVEEAARTADGEATE